MEHFSNGIITTITGMGIVFLVLIIIWGSLELMRMVFARRPEPGEAESAGSENGLGAALQSSAKPEPEAERSAAGAVSDSELVAVITAAIAASMNTSAYNLKIKSYKRIEQSAPAWNMAGRYECLNSRM